jgi:glycosyltransferase involved in cell wall biosynthesis
MKIALLTDGIYPYVIGGMQKHSYYLAKYLAREQVYIDLYHFKPIGSSSVDLFTEEELKYIHFVDVVFPEKGYLPGHYLHESFEYSSRIYQILKKRDPVDYIYAKGFTAWKLLDEKRKGISLPPVGVNFHGYEMFQPPASLRSRMEQMLLKGPVRFNMKYADQLFSYGGKITSLILELGIKQDKIIQIPSGIELDWIITAPVSVGLVRRFIFVGRYERRKGIEELTRVLEKWNGPEIQIIFVGPIPLSKRLKKEWIHYEGAVSDQEEMKRLMRGSNVLICPSHSEGMPNVILEGMASGLAIIATDVGAVSVMVDNRNGWLIQPGNEIALNNAMLEATCIEGAALGTKRMDSVEKCKTHFLWKALARNTLTEIGKHLAS